MVSPPTIISVVLASDSRPRSHCNGRVCGLCAVVQINEPGLRLRAPPPGRESIDSRSVQVVRAAAQRPPNLAPVLQLSDATFVPRPHVPTGRDEGAALRALLLGSPTSGIRGQPRSLPSGGGVVQAFELEGREPSTVTLGQR